MSEIPFEKTMAGRTLLEKQVPEFLRELKRLRETVERLTLAIERASTPEGHDEEGAK